MPELSFVYYTVLMWYGDPVWLIAELAESAEPADRFGQSEESSQWYGAYV